MANTKKLQLIIDAENRTKKAFSSVNSSLEKVQGRLEKMKPTFQKMAIAGGLAFGAISLLVKSSVSEIAKAEGAYNKFNTVFGEHSEDMISFVGELRKTMPTATSEIVRMAADLQDLLVPLGLSRELATDMSKGFLDVANKIAAFNDVEPTEVLEAIKSGLAGSSEPLRRYGVNALETALEARALEEGLLDVGQSFKTLDPEIKTQIRAQALLAQILDNSSDAIEGFEKNNDSFIRRQQELNATITETKEIIGKALIPMFDSLLKKILPVVKKIAEWIDENPKLTKVIIIVAAALAGLVTLIGLLGLILPVIITGFALLLSPITLVIAIIVALSVVILLVVKNWDFLKAKTIEAWDAIKIKTESAWNSIADYFKNLWQGIKDTFGDAIDWLLNKIQPFLDAVNKVKGAASGVFSYVGGKASSAYSGAKSLLGLATGGIVTKPTLAMIGESGAEAVIPLSRGLAGTGLGGLTINITGNEFVGEEGIAQRIGDEIMRAIKNTVKL